MLWELKRAQIRGRERLILQFECICPMSWELRRGESCYFTQCTFLPWTKKYYLRECSGGNLPPNFMQINAERWAQEPETTRQTWVVCFQCKLIIKNMILFDSKHLANLNQVSWTNSAILCVSLALRLRKWDFFVPELSPCVWFFPLCKRVVFQGITGKAAIFKNSEVNI